jgi:hypothetical protein
MAKRPSIVDRLAAPSPGIRTRKLVWMIAVVVLSGMTVGAILGKLFPEWLPQRPTTLPSATHPSATIPATTTRSTDAERRMRNDETRTTRR